MEIGGTFQGWGKSGHPQFFGFWRICNSGVCLSVAAWPIALSSANRQASVTFPFQLHDMLPCRRGGDCC